MYSILVGYKFANKKNIKIFSCNFCNNTNYSTFVRLETKYFSTLNKSCMEFLINSLLGGGGGLLMGMLGKGSNYGQVGNAVAGVVGGNVGGSLLAPLLAPVLGAVATGGDWKSMLMSAVGGMAMTYISSFIKNKANTTT